MGGQPERENRKHQIQRAGSRIFRLKTISLVCDARWQGVTANIRPPIFRKKIENYKKYANFKGEIRFPCEIQL